MSPQNLQRWKWLCVRLVWVVVCDMQTDLHSLVQLSKRNLWGIFFNVVKYSRSLEIPECELFMLRKVNVVKYHGT
jgi:hypothetical protein